MNQGDLHPVYGLFKSRCISTEFGGEAVPEDVLGRILDAGLWAPSGDEMQPWFLHVLTGKRRDDFALLAEVLWTDMVPLRIEDVADENVAEKLAGKKKLYSNLAGAPVAIVVFYEPLPDEPTGRLSATMLIQNILLAAAAEGLGSATFISIGERGCDICEFLGETRRFLACILLGYPTAAPESRKPRMTGRVKRH